MVVHEQMEPVIDERLRERPHRDRGSSSPFSEASSEDTSPHAEHLPSLRWLHITTLDVFFSDKADRDVEAEVPRNTSTAFRRIRSASPLKACSFHVFTSASQRIPPLHA